MQKGQQLAKETLVGIGQIFLQENGLSGLIIAFAMFFSHWALGVACLLGSLIGTLTAKMLNYPAEQIQQGLYGFNASLALMCVIFTFGETAVSSPLMWGVIWGLGVIAALVATLIMRIFIQRNWVAFTFPFVLSCWIFCWAVAKIELFGLMQNSPALVDYTQTTQVIHSPFYAWAEVNFGSNEITGVLLFIAIAISSPTAAIWGIAAAVIGTSFAHHLLGIDANALINGIYGFSPILVACVFAGRTFSHFCYVIVGTLFAVLIQFVVTQTGLASYTIGFIIASWLLLFVKAKIGKSHFHQHKWIKILNP